MTTSDRLRSSVLGLALVVSLAAAAPAWAAQRYAAPDSTDISGSCTQLQPCRIDHALNAATSGDEVVVLPGDYTLSTPLKATARIDVHGVAGQPAPRIHDGANVKAATVSLAAGGSISHMVIEGTNDYETLNLQGAVGDDLIVRSANAGAVVLRSTSTTPTVLRDTLADARGSDAPAVEVRNGSSTGAVSLVNVTAVGHTGLLLGSSSLPATVRNSIIHGDDKDIDANGGSADVDYSNFRPDASQGFTDGGHNQSAAPVFAGGQEFHEAATSPTVDAGSAATADLGATDPDGNPRTIGPAPDIGAFEYGGSALGTSGDDGWSSEGMDNTAAGSGTGIFSRPVPPVAGKSVQIGPASGTVLVRLPSTASFVALSRMASVPVGSTIDASRGVVRLTSARNLAGTPQTGDFWGGAFRIVQARSRNPITELRLSDAGMGRCRSSSTHSKLQAAGGPHSRRYLWGRDHHGRFRTRGRNAVATVRGTVWKTEDSCAGTRVTVKKGAVSVKNLHTRKTVLVKAGRSLLAHR